jgi:hypothetical protein
LGEAARHRRSRTTIKKASSIVRSCAEEAAQHRFAKLEERNRYLTEVFGKYVSEDVVTQLLASPTVWSWPADAS